MQQRQELPITHTSHAHLKTNQPIRVASHACGHAAACSWLWRLPTHHQLSLEHCCSRGLSSSASTVLPPPLLHAQHTHIYSSSSWRCTASAKHRSIIALQPGATCQLPGTWPRTCQLYISAVAISDVTNSTTHPNKLNKLSQTTRKSAGLARREAAAGC